MRLTLVYNIFSRTAENIWSDRERHTKQQLLVEIVQGI